MTRLKMGQDQHRSTLCDDVRCGGDWVDVQWSPDSSQIAFVSTSRNHQQENLRVADAGTGAIREVLEEKGETFLESGNGRVNWKFLPGSNEAIWFSQKDNWGQLYLHDLQTGKLKNAITSGEGNVTQLLRVDEAARTVYFLGVGKERGRDPYFRHFYRETMDGKPAQLLTPEDADHDISLSPSGKYFVDNYSKPDVPSTSVLRDATGKVVLQLEKMDISRLLATGWKPPMPITVKDRGGVNDLYGLMYRPTNFDPSKKYPIINNIYPGPQTGSVGSRQFSAARGDTQAIAELGFVVVADRRHGHAVAIEALSRRLLRQHGRQHAARSGRRHEGAGRALPVDRHRSRRHLRPLRRRLRDRGGDVPLSRISSRSASRRPATTTTASTKTTGPRSGRACSRRTPTAPPTTTTRRTSSSRKNLKGKLLLAHGTMDNNVPFYNTLLVVDALIKANKDFDLIIFPNRGHGFGNEPYMVRRRWDYFVQHLLGAEPPPYELKGAPAPPTATQ